MRAAAWGRTASSSKAEARIGIDRHVRPDVCWTSAMLKKAKGYWALSPRGVFPIPAY